MNTSQSVSLPTLKILSPRFHVSGSEVTSALSETIIWALSGYEAEMVPPVITCFGVEMLFIEVKIGVLLAKI